MTRVETGTVVEKGARVSLVEAGTRVAQVEAESQVTAGTLVEAELLVTAGAGRREEPCVVGADTSAGLDTGAGRREEPWAVGADTSAGLDIGSLVDRATETVAQLENTGASGRRVEAEFGMGVREAGA